MLIVDQYCNPEGVSLTLNTMSASGNGKEKRSSAYDGNFAQHLSDNYVFPPDIDHQPANYRDWEEVLIQPRASLSPSRNSDASYKSFVRAVGKAQNEDEVMRDVFPRIIGKGRPPSGQNVQFGHITALTPKIVVAKPDYYEGNLPGPGNRTLRERLNRSIIPSTHKDLPFLPTFFAEAKGSDGTIIVAERQLRHDGALGERAVHSVQSLGRGEKYDNKARTASAILHGRGNLDMFTHHMTQPGGHGTPAHTYMTPLGSYSLKHSARSFREGRTALRNTSDRAHQIREHAVRGANRRLGISTPEGSPIASRSTRRPLSCQAPIFESSDSDSHSSSEEDSDDDNDKVSSRLRSKGKLLKPKIVSAAPKRAARRDPSPAPRTRRRKAPASSDSDPTSSSEEEESGAPRRRHLLKPKIVTIAPGKATRREPSPLRRELRPRRVSRRP